jgi:hypothetical protein
MSLEFLPVCTMGDSVRIIVAQDGKELTRFDVVNRPLSKVLRSGQRKPAYFWLGAEADNG